MNTRPDRPSRLVITALAVALGLTAACGSAGDDDAAAELPTLALETADGDSPDDAAPPDSEAGPLADGPAEDVDPEIAMAEYEQCMREQGIEMSFAGDGGDGTSIAEEIEVDANSSLEEAQDAAMEDFEAAAEECDPILEGAFGSFELSPEQEAEMADQMLELERCLADRGFEIETENSSFVLGDEIDFEEFEAAMAACEPEPLSFEDVGSDS